jgi:Holliday junction resolvasome RuvABC endonuclease subunit
MKEVAIGLDISTSKIGLCVMDLKFNLLETTLIKLDTKEELEDRCIQLENYINDLNFLDKINDKGYLIKYVYVESAFIAFSGGKTSAVTMSKLQRFNGMVCYMLRKTTGIQPISLSPSKARGLVGLKIKRGENTKLKVIEHVTKAFPKDFLYELTRMGNPKPGTDDRADAIVIAWAGLNQKRS